MSASETATPFEDLKIAMLGLGSMNSAILKGLFQAGVKPENVRATTHRPESAEAKAAELGIQVVASETQANANVVAATGADIVFVGVLPPRIAAVCAEVRDVIPESALVVSVAAGVTVAKIEAELRPGQPAVRTMPNTPLQVGSGSVGLTPGAAVTEVHIDLLRDLFAPGGRVHVIPEDMMDEFNAMAGSAPGYLYYLAQHLTVAGERLGFDQKTSARLTADTMLGAAKILVAALEHDDDAARELREEMVLPGGTTRAAFLAFDEHKMDEAIIAGAMASAERSAEITRELADG